VATISGDNSACAGESVTFTASGGVSYVWNTGDVTETITVSDNTPKTVTVTDANGCTSVTSKTLVINPAPTASISGSNAICSGKSATFTASGGVSYIWSSGEFTNTITVNDDITREVTVTNANGCTNTAVKTLTVHANPVADIQGDDDACAGGIVTLTASGGTTYTWSTAQTGSSINVTTSGTRTVTVTDGNGCTDTADKTVTFHPNPVATISGDNSACAGESVTFTASGGVSYVWSSGEITSTITVSDNTPKTVTVTDANGCTDTETKTLIITTGSAATISGSNAICSGNSATFTASGGVSYVWSSGETTASITVTDNVLREVTVTDANGCTSTAVKTLTVHANPVADIQGDDDACAGGTITLTASGGTTYTWSTAQTSSSINVTASGTRTVTVTDGNGCTDTADKTVTFHPNPIASISGDNSVCQGGNVVFTATGGVSYAWSTGSTSSNITVSDNTPKTVTVTDANGCTDTETKTLTVYNNPTASISGDNSVCQGGSVVFTATGGVSYAWSTGSTSSNITVSNSTPVTVTVTDANGCTDTETKTLTIHNNPTASISGDDSVCQGGSVVFTATGGVSYAWSTGSTSSNITVSNSTPVTVTVTDVNGCTDTETKTLTINN
jgi:hypothetical protein